nr:cytochrome P450 4AV17 [Meteorus pulchricornis]
MDIQALSTLFLLFFTVALILFHYSVHGTKLGHYIDKIPGPKWYPIVGNAFDILVHLEDLWNFLRRSGRDFYPVNKFWIVNWPIVNIRHPDDVEILLSSNKHITKSVFYDFLHPWLNDGLLTSTGAKWRAGRKIITPAFHLNSLHEYSNNIIEQTERLIANLREESKSGDVDKELLPLVTHFTLNTICETAMGKTLDENNPEQDSYKRSVYDIGNIFYYRSVRPWLKNNWIFSLTSKGRDQLNALKILHGFTTKIIKEREQYHAETNGKYLEDFSVAMPSSSQPQTLDNKKKRRLAFLDLLIAASKRGLGLDDQGIREEVDTFVFEGHDTTAMSIFFTILLLAEHKGIQSRARDEIDAALKESNGKMSIDVVQQFTYLERCIKESLRLFPSVPAISRKVVEDLQLKHCFLPKGTILNVQIFDVHRDPNFWPRPNVYDPDRFLPERIQGRHPFSYIPFSGGPRNCIGQKFAMLELKILTAGILHNFHLEPLEVTSNIRILPDLVLRAAHPVHVKFIPIVK